MFSIRRARPVAVSIVLPAPVTLTVPPARALKPVRLVVSISRPPFVNETVCPVFAFKSTPLALPVENVLAGPLNTVEPPLLLSTVTPPLESASSLSVPLNVTVPPVRTVTPAELPAPSAMLPA